jgi:serine/threonine-protein phosphatase 6 regulatory ankyrin repeat subunit B
MGDLSATTALEEAPLAKKPKLETAPSTAEQLGTVGSDAVFNKLATSAPADGVSGLSVAMQAGPLAKKPKVETAPSSTEQLKLIDSGFAETQLDQSERLGSKLLDAARSGDLGAVENLLADGGAALVQSKSDDGSTALMLAAQAGQKEVVDVLVAANADVNTRSNDGLTALMNAANEGHWEIVSALVSANADVQCVNKDSMTALMHAAKAGQKGIISSLIAANADVRYQSKSPRVYVLKKGDRVEGSFVALGANQEKWYPGIVQALDRRWIGGDVISQMCTDYWYHLGLSQGEVDTKVCPAPSLCKLRVVPSLLRLPSPALPPAQQQYRSLSLPTVLVELCHRNSVQCPVSRQVTVEYNDGQVESYVLPTDELRVPPSAASRSGCPVGSTALMLSATAGNKEVMDVLVAANADVNTKSSDGSTALMLAADSGHWEIVSALIAANAGVRTKNENGMTALMYAAKAGQKETVDALIRANAHVQVKDNDGADACGRCKKVGHCSCAHHCECGRALREQRWAHSADACGTGRADGGTQCADLQECKR